MRSGLAIACLLVGGCAAPAMVHVPPLAAPVVAAPQVAAPGGSLAITGVGVEPKTIDVSTPQAGACIQIVGVKRTPRSRHVA